VLSTALFRARAIEAGPVITIATEGAWPRASWTVLGPLTAFFCAGAIEAGPVFAIAPERARSAGSLLAAAAERLALRPPGSGLPELAGFRTWWA
jgi:hypothetical protein